MYPSTHHGVVLITSVHVYACTLYPHAPNSIVSGLKVTGKRFAHATGPLLGYVRSRAGAAGVQVRFFHVKF